MNSISNGCIALIRQQKHYLAICDRPVFEILEVVDTEDYVHFDLIFFTMEEF